MIWERSGEAYYASVVGPDGAVQFHVIVEPTVTGWDWAIWRPGQSEREARHGAAEMVQEAMREAEGAAG